MWKPLVCRLQINPFRTSVAVRQAFCGAGPVKVNYEHEVKFFLSLAKEMAGISNLDPITRIIVLEAGPETDKICALACKIASEKGRYVCEKDLGIKCAPCPVATETKSPSPGQYQ